MNRKHLARTLLLILFLIFWAVSLRHLTAVPPVYEDEPWQASTGWKLAKDGVFGSDIFAGYYGMEAHYYGYMPVHPFLLAAVFKLSGLGLFQARFEAVVLGLFILALSYGLGRRLFRPSVGLLAVFLLLFSRTIGLTPSQYSGILFIDMARIARYDMAVPVFGLAALLLYAALMNNELRITNYELRTQPYVLRFMLYTLLGFLTALAALSHLYGLFWFASLLLLLLWHKTKAQYLAAFIAAFILPWIVYLVYVLPGWPDWVGQTQDYAPRFELFNLGWYWRNVLNEIYRYGPGLSDLSLFRPGFWTAVIIVPLSIIALGRQAWHGQKKAQTLLVPTVVLPILFALLIYLKLANYLVTIAPLFALVMGWGLVRLWEWGGRSPGDVGQFGKWLNKMQLTLPGIGGVNLLHLFIVCLLFFIGVEGASRFISLEQAAAVTTPYAEFSADIKQHLPPDGRILALHNYWFGFEAWDYRSWFVPLLQNNPDYWQPPLSIEAALNGVDPTIILIDRRMRALFAADQETAEAVSDWMAAQGFEQTAVVEDETYGRMEIYLKRSS